MKKMLKYIFMFAISFLFINNINASDRLTCTYTEKIKNLWEICYDRKLELIFLIEDDAVKIHKVIYKSIPESNCKQKLPDNLSSDEETIKEYCDVKEKIYSSKSPELSIDFKMKKGDDCPSNLNIDFDAAVIISKSANNTGFKLQSSKMNKVSCGNVKGIPRKIPELTSFIITVMQVAVPVILVILGSIDLFKGITAGKEDEIKKGQQMFIKRLVVAVIIFLVVIIVKFLISILSDSDNRDNIVDCIECFVSNDC